MADQTASHGKSTSRALLKTGLLALWVLVSFVSCFFARELAFMLAGWPFNYWMAAQGAVLCFIGIVVVYAGVMNRLERREAREAESGADA